MLLKILIVEDEVLIAETIRIHLEEEGHQVLNMCISYEEALAAYHQEKPDLVILDIRLYGEKSGIDFANYLKEQDQKTPFIFLTSQHDKRVLNLALETTPHGYLVKPIHKASLLTSVMGAYNLFLKGENSISELTIFDGQSNFRIKEDDIVLIKSEHVYANVHLQDGRTIITRKPLRKFLEQTKSTFFFQCHRSYIINTRHVNGWDHEQLIMLNGQIVPVSRSKKQVLMNLL